MAAAKHPTLPQNDNAQDRKKRSAQLAKTSESYVWTTTVATLPGVPLAASVPFSEDPTLEWLGLVTEVGLAIARNALSVRLSGADKNEASPSLTAALPSADFLAPPPPPPDAETAELTRALHRCDEMERALAELVKPPAMAERTGFLAAVETAVEEVEDAGELAMVAERTGLLRAQIAELQAMVETQTASLAAASAPSGPTAFTAPTAPVGATSLGAYDKLFATLPLPAIASTLLEDSTFARLRVAGPNPMLLTGIDKIPAKFPVSAEIYSKVMGVGDSLERALGDGRVYLLDYAELQALVPGEWQGIPKLPYAPLALFAVPVGGTSIVPVAIQCGQDPTRHPIFTPAPDGAGQWGWQMAKTTVQVADGNYHELYVHLARTHLVMEAFSIATRRELAEVHPLWGLLIPHVEGSLFINNLAATQLIGANGPIDKIFAGTIVSTQLTAAQDRLAFDFYGKMLPADLAARRVADAGKLPDYPYRDDALLVWQAIHDWVQQYIGIYYSSDTAVTDDFELAAWVTALASDGKLAGFKAITTRAQLASVCTMILFTGSAQHAAVNFPQKDVMTYAPAVTGAGWKAAPTVQAGHTKPEWVGYMPPISLALEQLNTLYLLGSVHYRPLGEYPNNNLFFPSWFRDQAVTNNALPRFRAALKAVETRIASRNLERSSPYPYLLPSLIPASINI